MAKEGSRKLTADEQRQVDEAAQRLATLRQAAEEAYAEGRLAEEVRGRPGIREQLQSSLDA